MLVYQQLAVRQVGIELGDVGLGVGDVGGAAEVVTMCTLSNESAQLQM